jgi:Domain of unknown function (DUF222)/HNH endonuclease
MFEEADLRKVESEIVELAGHLAAATCRFLQLLAEFDRRGGWAGPGLRSCAHWLNWRVGLSLRTAREHLRVAHALPGLPAVAEAFAAGRVSYAKVRAITRIATPSTEKGLLNIALHGTASHVETVVAAARAGLDRRPDATRRSLQWSRAADGSLLVRLRLPAEEGAQFVAAIEAVADGSAEPRADRAAAVRPDGSAEPPQPIATRRADALLALIAGHRPTHPPTVVIHVRADAPKSTHPDPGERPAAWIEGGPAIAPAVAERLTCGARVQALLVDRRGHPLNLGRTRRTVSGAQLRALRVRDRDQCVFPGCPQTRHLQAHHVRWWRRGGPTDLDNLALLCTFHHRLVHDHGYQLRRNAQGGFAATQPDATPIPAAGAPTRGRPDSVRHPGIDDRTITPRWSGERLDLDYVLAWLLPELRRHPLGAAA